VDPVGDGAADVLEVAERVRVEFARRIGIDDLLHPVPPAATRASATQKGTHDTR